jgi:hypothetical protein
MKKIFTVILSLVLSQIFAATITWTGAGGNSSWATAANWSTNTVPTSVDDVFIGASITMTVGGNCKSITFTQNGAGLALDDNTIAAKRLRVLGDVDFGGYSCVFRLGVLEVLAISGNFLNYSSADLQCHTTTADQASTVVYNGSVTQNIWGESYGILNLSGSGNKVLNEDVTILSRGTSTGLGRSCFVSSTTGSVTFGSSQTTTFSFNGTVSNSNRHQIIPALNFNNLVVTGARQTSNITFSSGTTKINGTFTVSSTFTTGALVMAGSTIEYSSTSASQNVLLTYNGSTNVPYNNVILSGSGVKTISGNLQAIVAGTLSLGTPAPSVNYNATSNQTVINGTYDALTLSGSGTKTISGTVVASSTLVSGVTVSYDGSAAQDVLSTTYSTLDLSGTGQKNIVGTVTATTLNANSSTISISTGTLSVTTFNAGTSTVNYSGTTQNVMSGVTFYNFILSGSGDKNLSGDLNVSNDLTLSGTASLQAGANDVSVTGNTVNGSSASIVKTSGDFTVKGNFQNDGTFTNGSGKLIFGGSANSQLSGTGSVSASLVEISKLASSTLTLNNTLDIPALGTLTFTNGTSILDANGKLILNSDATGYAYIPEIPTGSSITGSSTMEMYINSTLRLWWHLTNPVNSVAATDWIDDFPITGSFVGASVLSPSSNLTSAYSYDETNTNASMDVGWTKFPNANVTETMSAGKGYRAFIRDNNTTSTPKTLDVTGVLNNGNINIPLSYTNSGNPGADGWNFVGNPYPATIDWTTLSGDADLIDANAYVWDAVAKAYDFSTTIKISPFQGFWVQVNNAGNGELNLTESLKSTSVAIQRKASIDNEIKITLVDNNVDESYNKSKTSVFVNEFATTGFDRELEASHLSRNFMSGLDEEVLSDISSVTENGKELKNNYIPESEEAQEVQLNTILSNEGTYILELKADDFSYSDDLVLVDSYTNKEIAFDNELDYDFSVDGSAASQSSSRFKLKIGAKNSSAQEESFATVQLFPNPAEDYINLKLLAINGDVQLQIVDALGNEVYQESVENGASSLERSIDVSSFNSGMYFLNVTNKGQTETQKFIVK